MLIVFQFERKSRFIMHNINWIQSKLRGRNQNFKKSDLIVKLLELNFFMLCFSYANQVWTEKDLVLFPARRRIIKQWKRPPFLLSHLRKQEQRLDFNFKERMGFRVSMKSLQTSTSLEWNIKRDSHISMN